MPPHLCRVVKFGRLTSDGRKNGKMKVAKLVALLNICVITNATNIFVSKIPEDANLNFTVLGVKYGHQVEEREVITEDGYILTLFHIPGRRKTPVLLMHGTADYADTFILRGKKSLAIALADADYDVWVGNLRGNKYARRHISLNPDTDPEFWNFSFHETGNYDLAATIDHVLEATGERSLQTIGHSQGTTIHFALLSTRPEYNEKIKLFIALAPVAYLNHIPPPVSTIIELGPIIDGLVKKIGIGEFPSKKLPLPRYNDLECTDTKNHVQCSLLSLYYSILFDPKALEPEFFQVLLGHYPGATSRKMLVHYNQIALSKRFSKYDYGPIDNYKRYGRNVPPEYDLQQVKVKTAMFVGRNDKIATVKDSELLRELLPNVVFYHIMEPKMWNHVDFLWRRDMDVYLFPSIFNLLKKHNV